MKYYDEQGNLLEETPDLSTGKIVPREYKRHEAVPEVTHKESKTLPDGTVLTYSVVDSPAKQAWNEIVSYTYYRYVDHPTLEMRMGAAENAIADIAMEVYG